MLQIDKPTKKVYQLIDEDGVVRQQAYSPKYSIEASYEDSFHHECATHALFKENQDFDDLSSFYQFTTDDLYKTFDISRNKKVQELELDEKLLLFRIRGRVKQSVGMLCQKVFAPYRSGLQGTLDHLNSRKTINGFLARMQDVSMLTTPEQMIMGLGLDYNNKDGTYGPFFAKDSDGKVIGFVNHVYALRYLAQNGNNRNVYRIPFGAETEEQASLIWSGIVSWVRHDPDPFTGNGFTKSKEWILPEFCIEEPIVSEAIPNDAEIYEITANGSELVAVFKTRIDGFLRASRWR